MTKYRKHVKSYRAKQSLAIDCHSYSYSCSYRVSLTKQLFSEESCSVVSLSEKMSFQLRSELSATVER